MLVAVACRRWARTPVASVPIRRRFVSTHITPGLLDELDARGFVAATTSPLLAEQLNREKTAVYVGFDPSASSLHVGNLLPLLCLLHFKQAGHHALALIGGATGFIGDPSGRSTERQALDPVQLAHNVGGITTQVERFFQRGQTYAESKTREATTAAAAATNDATVEPVQTNDEPVKGSLDVVNNYDWTAQITLLDFLKTVGKRSKVNSMLARDSVKNRLSSEHGISFTEFSYQLLQAHDFKHLHDAYGCKVQLGGSDQWGNIVSGIDMIKRMKPAQARKGMMSTTTTTTMTTMQGQQEAKGVDTKALEGEEEPAAYGLTIPLLTTSSGEKFGKSAGNAVWLDPEMTSVFDFYQYFFRTTDADVAKFLRLFTLLPLEWTETIVKKHQADPSARIAQRVLAGEVTELVHGAANRVKAQTASTVLYTPDLEALDPRDVWDAFHGDKSRLIVVQDALTPPRTSTSDQSPPAAAVMGTHLTKLYSSFGLCKTRKEAVRALKAGGLYLNGHKVTDEQKVLERADLVKDTFAVLGLGKSEKKILWVQRGDQ